MSGRNRMVGSRPTVGFKNFTFGYAAAEDEVTLAPRLLLDGFLDVHGCVKELLEGHPFLVLGYKGSGKSAIAQHIQLRTQDESQLFVQTLYLNEFPYQSFVQIPSPAGSEGLEAITWTWLLLLYLLDSFRKDLGSSAVSDPLQVGTITALQETGLLPTDRIPVLVQLST